MAAPTITIDLAFGSNPGAASFNWTNIHTDGGVARIRDLTYNRGRLNELNQMQAGLGGLLLLDIASDFDSSNPAGLFSPNAYGVGVYGAGFYGPTGLRPYTPVRAQATIGGVTYPLFQHYVERMPRSKREVNAFTERSLTTVDGFEWMANAGLAGVSYSSEAAGTRIGNVLTTIGWSSTLRTIATGDATMQASSFAATDSMKALTHILQAQQDENGLFYIDGSGKAVFVNRHALISSPYTVSQAAFKDANSAGAAGYPYTDLVPTYDLDTTFNVWTGTRSGGAAQTASDAASQAAYGLRTQTFSSLVTADPDVLSQAQWKLGQFKNPLNRVSQMTVMPGTDTAFWQTVLGLELGMRVTVREQAPGFAAPTSTDYTIQSIGAHFPQGTSAQAEFTFGLWPAQTTAFWVLNTSKLDTTTVLAY